jgi:hypothetical protein
MAKPHIIDYKSFLPRLVAGLRKAWQQVRRQRPGETFYTFGIETDSDITDLNPVCNTEEEYRSQGGGSQPAVHKWVGCANQDSDLYRAGKEHTAALAREVNHYVFEDHSKDPEEALLDRKKRLLRVFEKALVQLDDEGFFGTGKQRHNVLLKIEFVDPSDAEWRHMRMVIQRINPPESAAELLALVGKEEQSQSAGKAGEEAIVAMATEFLRTRNRTFLRCLGPSRARNPDVLPFLFKRLGEAPTEQALWYVTFEGAAARTGKSSGTEVINVIVNPATGHCALDV